MCGLVGWLGAPDPRRLQWMLDAVAHRGPDDVGSCIDAENGVVLGHRRLAIIDPETGQQPMEDAAGHVAVVFNGAIYNHVELRRELEARGHVFRSDHSDTEVLVQGYLAWGEDLPRRLNGMFAFVIYDRRRRTLFLARDRFGEKPLFYLHDGQEVRFASELKALLRPTAPPLDRLSLKKFFAHGFFPAPATPYRQVFKIPAGCRVTVDIPSRNVVMQRYFRFEVVPDTRLGERPVHEVAEELESLLATAVRRRMIADVPLGVALSGGIDSSAILAFATKIRPGIETFTVGFAEATFDERRWARVMAERFGAVAHELELSLDDARAMAPDLLSRMDEPIGDSSVLPVYLLSRFARSAVKVLIGGDGGDELFAGYETFRAMRVARWYERIMPRAAHGLAIRLADLLPISDRNISVDFRIRRALAGLSLPPALWMAGWQAPLSPGDLGDLFEEPTSLGEIYAEVLEARRLSQTTTDADWASEYYAGFFLPDRVLTKVDRASMLVGLETRAPFLDNDLVDFARRLPHRLKYRAGETKWLLRRALRRLLPSDILDRPKAGFRIPLTNWLRTMPQIDPPLELATLSREFVARRWAAHRARRLDDRLFLWCWMSACCALGAPPGSMPTSPVR